MRKCPNRRCFVPDVNCALGEPTPSACKVWVGGATQTVAAQEAAEGTQSLAPWSGAAMGTRDLAFLTGRGEAKLIAIIGAHNAGKTTLLAAWYQHLGRNGRTMGQRFAGSFSLTGWEAVAHALRWEGGVPKFPAHTSSGAGRAPGMLHLALRAENGELNDFLFADSPGEWFQRWAVDRDANDAEGARWLADRTSVMLLVADCEALSGPQRGSARSDFIQLIRRAAQERRDRPVALVWTKADVAIAEAIRKAVQDAAHKAMPDILEFHVSIKDFDLNGQHHVATETVEQVLAWAIEPLARGFVLPDPEIAADDPFFHIGSVA
jgi:hypothetical protein